MRFQFAKPSIPTRSGLGLFAAGSLMALAVGADMPSAAPITSRGNPARIVTAKAAIDPYWRTSIKFWETGVAPIRGAASAPGYVGRRVKVGRHVFLADAALNTVAVFTNGQLNGYIGGFNEPQGITTDASGTLYVADTAAQRVLEFAPPYERPPVAKVVEKGKYPVDVAVANDGTVAVLNICTGPSCSQPGSVDFFAKGNTTSPCASISGGQRDDVILFGAFDASGTLYFGGTEDDQVIRVARISGECNATRLVFLKTSYPIQFPAGTQVDTNGNIAFGNSHGFSGPPEIDLLAPPQTGSTKLKLLSVAPLSNSFILSSFALTKSGTDLYTAEPHDSLEYAYPAGGSAISVLNPGRRSGDLIEGVAVTPAEVP